MKRYGATQNVIYLRTLSNNIDFQFNYLLVFPLYYESSHSIRVHVHSRGCYVNVETYTKVFSDKQDWKNIWNMIIRGSRHKRVHRLSIGG